MSAGSGRPGPQPVQGAAEAEPDAAGSPGGTAGSAGGAVTAVLHPGAEGESDAAGSPGGPVTAVLHPGAMGATVAAACGGLVLWASRSRSAATRARAAEAGLTEAADLGEIAERADTVISVCPPHAAEAVAEEVAAAGFDGRYVDANAVSPATARRMAARFERFVDGGIIGPPAVAAGTTRLYLSGPGAAEVAALFKGSVLDARPVPGGPGTASALKMAYAAWTKGTSALLLAVAALARANGVDGPLAEEWEMSQPGLVDRLADAADSMAPKAWRWSGEMAEIADTFAAAGLPDGFHRAAAAVYRRLEGFKDVSGLEVADALAALAAEPTEHPGALEPG